MQVAKICDEIVIRMRKKQKLKTNNGRRINPNRNRVITLPNSESAKLPLPNHELWDEKQKAVTNLILLTRMEKWKPRPQPGCTASLPKCGTIASTMQRLQDPRFIAAAHSNPLPIEHDHRGLAVVLGANFLDELEINDE